jgi:hypothetical protein
MKEKTDHDVTKSIKILETARISFPHHSIITAFFIGSLFGDGGDGLGA